MERGHEVLEVHSELSNRENKEALIALAQSVTTQINLSMVSRVNVVESTMTSRLRYFVRINPPIFHGSKLGEDPQEFLDGVYKVLSAIGLHLCKRHSCLRTN